MGSSLNKLRGLLHSLVVGSPSAAGTGVPCALSMVSERQPVREAGAQPETPRHLLPRGRRLLRLELPHSGSTARLRLQRAREGQPGVPPVRHHIRPVRVVSRSLLAPLRALPVLFQETRPGGRALFVFLAISLSGIVVDILKFILGDTGLPCSSMRICTASPSSGQTPSQPPFPPVTPRH